MIDISTFKNIHHADRCFILGSGPSIANQDLAPLKNEITFCSNWFFNHDKFSQLNINYYCAYDPGFVQPAVNEYWKTQINRDNLQVFFFLTNGQLWTSFPVPAFYLINRK